jgi:hypothetical protein
MSSFYDDASLVMIPSGYKNAKIYCEKPTDGTGDLTFTRASNATRVASNGLIQKVRTNLLTYSEQFDNAAWTKTQTTVSANTTTAPDGTNTAETLLEQAISGIHIMFQNSTITGGVEYTFSVYAKYNGRVLQINASSALFGLNVFANFDLQNGVLGTVGSAASASITNAGNGWYRCSITGTATSSGSGGMAIALVKTTTSVRNESYLGVVTNGAFIWGGQVETGVLTDYIATTTTAVSVGPVSGLPRLDYLNSSCPRLLLEGQRSNVITFSENFDNAGWTKTNATITANAGVSPDGYTNADRLIPSNAAQGILQQNHNITAGQSNTLSVFAKASGLNDNFVLNSRDNASASNFAQIAFNLSTGTIATAATSSGSYSAASGTITPYGNGWYRLTLTHTSSISTTTRFRYFNETASGDGTNGYLVYGAQAELNASYASSYVNTLSTSVTRVADIANKTSISSLIGATEGVMFMDCILPNGGNPILMQLSNNTNSFSQSLYVESIAVSNTIRANFYDSGLLQASFSLSGATVGQRYKIAAAYKQNDFALYINGVQVGVDTSGTVQAGLQDLQIGHLKGNTGVQDFNGNIVNQALLFKTRLTNAQLAELTTL